MRRAAARWAAFAGFQAAWLACVLGAAHGRPLVGPLAVGVLAAAFVGTTRPRRGALALIVAAAAMGLVVDGALVLSGRLTLGPPGAVPAIAAPWMVALWPALATTLPALGFLRGRHLAAAALGAVSAPLAYLAGARLGAVSLGEPATASLAAIGAAWALALPALVAIAGRLVPARPVAPAMRETLA